MLLNQNSAPCLCVSLSTDARVANLLRSKMEIVLFIAAAISRPQLSRPDYQQTCNPFPVLMTSHIYQPVRRRGLTACCNCDSITLQHSHSGVFSTHTVWYLQHSHSGVFSTHTLVSSALTPPGVFSTHTLVSSALTPPGVFSTHTLVSSAPTLWCLQHTLVSSALTLWCLQHSHSGVFSTHTLVSSAYPGFFTHTRVSSCFSTHTRVAWRISTHTRVFHAYSSQEKAMKHCHSKWFHILSSYLPPPPPPTHTHTRAHRVTWPFTPGRIEGM